MTSRLSFYHAVTPPMTNADGVSFRVVLATRTAETRVLAGNLWAHIAKGDFHLLDEDTRHDLEQIELLVPTDEDELKTVTSRNAAAESDRDVLSLVIQPTAICELSCGYCGQEHRTKWLSEGHQERLVSQTEFRLRQRPRRTLSVYWFGAEPMAGFSVIQQLTSRLKDLAAKYATEYVAAMVTNGYQLTAERARQLHHQYALKEVTITLDGPPPVHDRRRPTKLGRPSFGRIFDNLLAIARVDDLDQLTIKIRCNVDASNADAVVPLLRLLAEHGLHTRIWFYVMPVHAWGNDADRISLAPDVFANKELEWFREMHFLGYRLALLPKRKPVVCVAASPDADVIDAYGAIYKCTEVPYVPSYGTPNRWAVGHLDAPPEAPRRPNSLALFNEQVSQRHRWPCHECRMYPVCGGACPKLWHEGHSPCPSAKRNIEGRLVLALAAMTTTSGTSTPPAL
jgi:uncharacterized protein